MPRRLPPHPNLDHLRKQAKDLLQASLLHNPSAKLADAQHAIALEYGFASWPKLKAHVESSEVSARRQEPNPLVGRWTADVSKSTRHPANPFRHATIQIDITGDTVTIFDTVINDAGRADRSMNAFRADGLSHPTASGDGYALTATWRGTHVLETVATKDGTIVGRGVYQVSTDGKTLTVAADQQLIVLDRQEVPSGSPG